MFCVSRAGAGIAAAAVFFVLCVSSSAADEADCKLHRLAYLDVTPDHAQRPTVQVLLNGTPKQFVIDTAGIYSAVTPETATALKLKTAHMSTKKITHLVSGESPDIVAYVDEMKIGRLPIPNMALFVMTPSMVSPDSDGLISGEILHVFDVEYDPAAAKLSLFQPNNCPAHIVHWTTQTHAELDFQMNRQPQNNDWRIIMTSPEWHIIAPAKLDGHDIEVTIDTGAYTSLLLSDDADAMLSTAEKKKLKAEDTKISTGETIYSYPFQSLDLGEVQIRNPHVMIYPGSRDRLAKAIALKPQLILGTSILNQLHFYIDYKSHKIYLTPASAH